MTGAIKYSDLQEDGGSFKGLNQFHDMILDLAVQASADGMGGMPHRHLLQSNGLGNVCRPPRAFHIAENKFGSSPSHKYFLLDYCSCFVPTQSYSRVYELVWESLCMGATTLFYHRHSIERWQSNEVLECAGVSNC